MGNFFNKKALKGYPSCRSMIVIIVPACHTGGITLPFSHLIGRSGGLPAVISGFFGFFVGMKLRLLSAAVIGSSGC